jgi:hypothetical protein
MSGKALLALARREGKDVFEYMPHVSVIQRWYLKRWHMPAVWETLGTYEIIDGSQAPICDPRNLVLYVVRT